MVFVISCRGQGVYFVSIDMKKFYFIRKMVFIISCRGQGVYFVSLVLTNCK